MTGTTDQNKNTHIISNNMGMSPGMMITPNMGGEQMLNAMMAPIMMNLIAQTNNTEMSFQKILLIVLVMCIKEVKELIMEWKSQIPKLGKYILEGFKQVYKDVKYKLPNLSKKSKIDDLKDDKKEDDEKMSKPAGLAPMINHIHVCVDCTSNVMMGLYKYAQKHMKFSDLFKMDSTTSNLYEVVDLVLDIEDNIKAKLKSTIYVRINPKTEEISKHSTNNDNFIKSLNPDTNPEDITNLGSIKNTKLFGMFTDEFKSEFIDNLKDLGSTTFIINHFKTMVENPTSTSIRCYKYLHLITPTKISEFMREDYGNWMKHDESCTILLVTLLENNTNLIPKAKLENYTALKNSALYWEYFVWCMLFIQYQNDTEKICYKWSENDELMLKTKNSNMLIMKSNMKKPPILSKHNDDNGLNYNFFKPDRNWSCCTVSWTYKFPDAKKQMEANNKIISSIETRTIVFDVIDNNIKPLSTKELYDKFNEYFEKNIIEIIKQSQDVYKPCVYTIKLEKKKVITKIDNPAYKEWLAKKEPVKPEDKETDKQDKDKETDKQDKKDKKDKDKKDKDKDSDSESDIAVLPQHPGHAYYGVNNRKGFKRGKKQQGRWDEFDYGLPYGNYYNGYYHQPQPVEVVPPQQIDKTTYTREIISHQVNKFKKDISTLYLPDRQKKSLMNVVSKFRDNKDMYDKLGLPYKLGIMIYGAPGTGKTTAIKSIATYLRKDVCFIDLKNVTSNADLKEIFTYINDKYNNAIIMFEDIDANSEVVHRRDVKFSEAKESEKRKTLIDTVNDGENTEEPLTLSYMLNLLDGTLCQEGTIFAMTTNHIEVIDPALYRPGRVDLCMEFKPCEHTQIAEIFRNMKQREIDPEILKQIPEYKYAPCDIIFHIYKHILDEDITDAEIMAPYISSISD
jgi:ABC-type multidrug transport system ATPase subunit